jgi:diamine N-acetyltransferase
MKSMIQKLEEQHIEDLTLLAQKIFADTFLPTNTPENVYDYVKNFLNVDCFRNDFKNKKVTTYGVFNDDKMIGYVQLVLHDEVRYGGARLELKRFYLEQAFHGKGYAQAMMEVCFGWARTVNEEKIWLGVWEHNHRARKFYEKCGFVKTAEHIFVMGQAHQTDHIFIKSL